MFFCPLQPGSVKCTHFVPPVEMNVFSVIISESVLQLSAVFCDFPGLLISSAVTYGGQENRKEQLRNGRQAFSYSKCIHGQCCHPKKFQSITYCLSTYHLEHTEVLTVVVSFGVGRKTIVEEILEGINNTKSFLIKTYGKLVLQKLTEILLYT